MKNILILSLISVFLLASVSPSIAQDSSAIDLLRAGLLGAGSGAIGGAASGAKGSEIWKGALAGAGVNIIGEALLDVMTRGSAQQQPQYYTAQTQPQTQYYAAPVRPQTQSYYSSQSQYQDSYNEIYQAGYSNGYKEGYAEGLRDALREYYGN